MLLSACLPDQSALGVHVKETRLNVNHLREGGDATPDMLPHSDIQSQPKQPLLDSRAHEEMQLKAKNLLEDGEDLLPDDDIRFLPRQPFFHSRTHEQTSLRPTPWKMYWEKEQCELARRRLKADPYFMNCQNHAPIIYSPKFKVAYMKTPKVASTAFFTFFNQTFPDAISTIGGADVPDDVYVFTFVRHPIEHKKAGYAEVNLKANRFSRDRLTNLTTFQDVPQSRHHGHERFKAFLDDIWFRRFDIMDVRKPGHAGNQLKGISCSHDVNYIGHLETLTADWDRIQEEAKIPKKMRTTAIPAQHAETAQLEPDYAFNEDMHVGNHLKDIVCKMFSSEWACLGYDVPQVCLGKYGLGDFLVH